MLAYISETYHSLDEVDTVIGNINMTQTSNEGLEYQVDMGTTDSKCEFVSVDHDDITFTLSFGRGDPEHPVHESLLKDTLIKQYIHSNTDVTHLKELVSQAKAQGTYWQTHSSSVDESNNVSSY